MIRLNPCPFCGSVPLFDFIRVDTPVTNFDKYYRLGCKRCDHFICYTIHNMMDEKEHEKAKIHLAEEWNKRSENAHFYQT